MIPMTKNGTTVYVPDIFVESYRRDGYTAFGEEAVEAAPSPAVEEIAEEEVDNNIDEAVEANAEAVEAAPSPAVEEAPDDVKEEPAPDPDKFVCPICGKEYTRKSNLDRHIKEKHS